MLTPWGVEGDELVIAAPLVAAHVVWVVAGVAWMQRLPRRYAEATGRRFDTVPAMLLFVAAALATSAGLLDSAL